MTLSNWRSALNWLWWWMVLVLLHGSWLLLVELWLLLLLWHDVSHWLLLLDLSILRLLDDLNWLVVHWLLNELFDLLNWLLNNSFLGWSGLHHLLF